MSKIKNMTFIVLAIIFSSIFLGCIGSKETKLEPKADGKALYDYITKGNNYKSWEKWPGKGELYPGKEPHGSFLTTYVTDNALSAISGKKGSMPDESIIVKENYSPDKKLAAITVMYNETGYDAEHNDWFWVKYEPDGKIDAQGKVQGCIDCHGQKKDNDYIWTGDIK